MKRFWYSARPSGRDAAPPALLAELTAYRDARRYDPLMSGPTFKGWNFSQLDRARRLTEKAEKAEGVAP
jgi:hypothetical protein